MRKIAIQLFNVFPSLFLSFFKVKKFLSIFGPLQIDIGKTLDYTRQKTLYNIETKIHQFYIFCCLKLDERFSEILE